MVEDAKAYHQTIKSLNLMTYCGTHHGFNWVPDSELVKNNLVWENGRLKQIFQEVPCMSCARRIDHLLNCDLSGVLLKNSTSK